ncbi:MAG: plasmid maintenance system killer protein [Planctomycetes bacterium]|nr:plasmid maintenance system killer protein [Planctomycetota bacterium]
MQINFENRELKKLYETGKCRKYRIPEKLIRRFLIVVEMLKASDTIYDLWKEPSLNFERLRGQEHSYSVRLDRKYRLEMEIEWENEEKTVGEIFLKEISLHYGD